MLLFAARVQLVGHGAGEQEADCRELQGGGAIFKQLVLATSFSVSQDRLGEFCAADSRNKAILLISAGTLNFNFPKEVARKVDAYSARRGITQPKRSF